MSRQISARILVAGEAARLAGFRRRVNALLDAGSVGPYRELHTAGALDYRLQSAGVPYPQLVAASAEYPELVIEVAWENPAGATGGTARILAGRLAEQATEPAPGATCELRVQSDGTLVLGLTCRQWRGEWIGYALTARSHAFFRLVDGVLEAAHGVEPAWAERWTLRADGAEYLRLDPPEPIEARTRDELDRLANGFADEWIWFDAEPEADVAVERRRYAAYGWTVSPANVRAAKLKTVLREAPAGGYALESADPDARRIAAALARWWLSEERH